MNTISPRSQMEEISMYSPGKPIEELQRELGITHVIKMASNENPYGASPLAQKAITAEIKDTHYYPEITAPVLKHKLAHRLDVNENQLIFGNGSDEIIGMLTRTYLQENDEVIMASVTFPRYKTNVIIDGGIPIEVPMKQGGLHDLQAMTNAITESTKMIFVCNPNNPTGTIISAHELLEFIKNVPPHILVIVDEAYYEYIRSDDYFATLHYLDEYPNLIALRTFSKIYGLASLRIGYGIMHPSIVSELLKSKDPFNVNRFAQAAALACLDDYEFMRTTQEQNNAGRQYLENEFKRLDLSYFSTHTNFIMVDTNMAAETINDELLKRGIIIRPGHMMGYPTMIRVTIGTTDENQLFISALEEILSI
ncbi:histidinol-phosphate aminotransferase [Geomicrobium halophilum]|uniref:Histidinol-phosphate aminotransferase n=1 Tax=Geomicrobium halophilum TaxID=549000 RepID=A0A841PRB3_9BACL|nr:histidinol-phosphate transaminase [Geomicrobium halophilum]MBB6451330.1 histidinol-phosphate aminotransferase [Geomicrobium halophilum]